MELFDFERTELVKRRIIKFPYLLHFARNLAGKNFSFVSVFAPYDLDYFLLMSSCLQAFFAIFGEAKIKRAVH